jgi:hypothetical protein
MRFDRDGMSLAASIGCFFGLPSTECSTLDDKYGYPSHFRPVPVHLKQWGFVSSHLTRRILELGLDQASTLVSW